MSTGQNENIFVTFTVFVWMNQQQY